MRVIVPFKGTPEALQTPDTKERMAKLGAEPMLMAPAEFDAHIKTEIGVKAAAITVN